MTEYGFDLRRRLEARDRNGLRRDLEPAERVASRTRFAPDPRGRGGAVDFDEPALVFASNNYLGLARDRRVQRAAERAIHGVGTGAGASRLVTGDTSLHRALERDLAACKRTERALVFSSGYAANVGTIAALEPDRLFSDALNHASIIDGCRLADAETVVYDHCDPDDLAAKCDSAATEAAPDEQWLIVTDSVFSMDGDVAPLEALCEIAETYGAWLMVDEAHATGLFDDGGGVVQREGLSDRVDVQMGTLSKALASQGGYVAGSEPLVEHLLNDARSFVYSTGLAPPAVGAAREALRIAREEDRADRLWETVERLREGLETAGYVVLGESHVLPVLVGDRELAVELAGRVRDHGVVAPPIRPPTVPEGESRIRVAPMATHDRDDVDACLEAFEEAGRAVGVLP
ncbi:aminotransferase class I/II-fold pyridoxal phosphate-dependent enzyme [Natronobacterium gregoryi]|uniref:8-amino-7-oxononanoate synthase n=2 Tax=Natronobacterium gregoryi TaxID=44930 RepID=L0AHJ9_NATGS|nr:aminotransferase class I/II-fold pyridoxal phosphate-dependent enzyme [Natronobacterium gregoryi]AFZ73383.1 7-keto-8-aminopelargonate synthetase-like enzyme [Natronobacterium gregoryi SP2]ELY68579.1 8-amino-7-oxononanoate synthase [Natronobacterium gregoryi SP2]PLK19663.1 8-amino-7-oxononanoate synthase [Natronobacterium gregoryi SP2]SFI73576.1 8-amino-7-oxononanoate synthase [Natronobacterium gregoryi]